MLNAKYLYPLLRFVGMVGRPLTRNKVKVMRCEKGYHCEFNTDEWTVPYSENTRDEKTCPEHVDKHHHCTCDQHKHAGNNNNSNSIRFWDNVGSDWRKN